MIVFDKNSLSQDYWFYRFTTIYIYKSIVHINNFKLFLITAFIQ